MKLYNSHITKNIFSNLEKENKTIITQINGKSIKSFDFKNNILNVAKNLNDFGIIKNSKIAIFLKDNILFSNIIISSILCSSQVVLLDPSMGKKILTQKIIFSKITHIFIEGFLYDYLFLTKSEVLKLNIKFIINGFSIFGIKNKKLKEFFKENNDEVIFLDACETDEIITVFTGGTTGSPKGVVHCLESIYKMLDKIKYFVGETKIFYADMPHFLLLGLLTNAQIVSGPYNIKAKKLKTILEKFKIDTYFSPPYKYNYFIENNIKIPETLTNIMLGSAPIYKSFLEKLFGVLRKNQKVTCIYGMTEMLPIAYIDGKEKLNSKVNGDLLGYFLQNIDYKIIENELFVKGDHKMKKYLGENMEEFIKTGDLVNICDKKLVMIGRKKDMIIKKEYNIYPGIYEPIVCQIPGVFNCAFVGIYDEKLNDEKIILFVEMGYSHKKYDENYILNFLKSGEYSIDKYALPDEIIFGKLPKIGRQEKIDKNKLREIYLKNNLGN